MLRIYLNILKLRSTQLDALLRGWTDYEKMLNQFESGMGSMDKEASKTAESLEGRLNELSNTWTDTVENLLNTDSLKTVVDVFNGLLNAVNSLTEAYDKFSSSISSLFGLLGDGSSFGGTLGAITGYIMHKNGAGEYKSISVGICNAPTSLRLCNNAT